MEAAHLAARRLRVHPTAIGLIPPSGFLRAIKLAPKKNGLAAAGTSPLKTRLIKDVRE
jgi:hypothetical protein